MTLLLVGLVLLCHPYIDLEAAHTFGSWEANAPIADIAALLLLPLALRMRPIPLPGIQGYGLFLLFCLVGLAWSVEPGHSLHVLVRKPGFYYLVYGVGLARITAGLPWASAKPGRGLQDWVYGALLLTAVVSLATSMGRLDAGHGLWYSAIEGLTPNHKTLGVTLAGWLPLVCVPAARGDRRSRWLSLVLLAAIGLSFSKTAWITALFGLGWAIPPARPFSQRPRLAIPLVLLAIVMATSAPLLFGSKSMLDAARSRHSMNQRAWMMVQLNPLLGTGVGSNTVIQMTRYPHYRINGVDAHGVVQKIGSETGLLGLAAYGWFVFGTAAALRRRENGGPLMGTWLALHLNLLLSTETFSPTHWVPLAIIWGHGHRPRDTS